MQAQVPDQLRGPRPCEAAFVAVGSNCSGPDVVAVPFPGRVVGVPVPDVPAGLVNEICVGELVAVVLEDAAGVLGDAAVDVWIAVLEGCVVGLTIVVGDDGREVTVVAAEVAGLIEAGELAESTEVTAALVACVEGVTEAVEVVTGCKIPVPEVGSSSSVPWRVTQ